MLIGVKDTGLSFSASLHGENIVENSLFEAIKKIFSENSEEEQKTIARNILIPNSSLSKKEQYSLSDDDKDKKYVVVIIDDNQENKTQGHIKYIKKSSALSEENRVGKINADVVMTNTDAKIGLTTADSCVINISGLDQENKSFTCSVNLGHTNADIIDVVLETIKTVYDCEPKNLHVSVGHYSRSRFYVDKNILNKYQEYHKTFTQIKDPNLLNKIDRNNLWNEEKKQFFRKIK